MLLKDINPFVRQAITGRINSDVKTVYYNKIKTCDCRLFYIISGFGEMEIKNNIYSISPGTVIMFSSGTEYMWRTNTVDYYAINFDYTQNFSHICQTFHPIAAEAFQKDNAFENIVFSDYTMLNDPIIIYKAMFLEDDIRRLTTEYHMGGACKDILISSVLKSVIINIVRRYCENTTVTSSKNAELVRDIINYITSNYNKNITNESIAGKFNFNTQYINRVFKKHTGQSMHKFLLNYRMNTAIDLLITQNYSVNEIARMTGFNDLPHFIKSFKKITGKTPTQYRAGI